MPQTREVTYKPWLFAEEQTLFSIRKSYPTSTWDTIAHVFNVTHGSERHRTSYALRTKWSRINQLRLQRHFQSRLHAHTPPVPLRTLQPRLPGARSREDGVQTKVRWEAFTDSMSAFLRA